MTGPFFVEGAEPGDALVVGIDRLTPSRATGWTYSPLALNVVDPARSSTGRRRSASSGASTARPARCGCSEPAPGLEDFVPAARSR